MSSKLILVRPVERRDTILNILVETINIFMFLTIYMYEISKMQSNRFLNDKNVFTISQKLRSTNPKEIIASDYEKKYELKKS